MKKGIYIVVIVILLLIINGLIHSILDLWGKQNLVTQAQKELDEAKKENTDLKKQLALVQTKGFIEAEARNKLFLVKPGESEVLIEQDLIQKRKPRASSKPTDPPFEQWISLFFHE